MALAMIGNITAVPEIGKTYLGKVVRIAEFGAFVELFPGTDGLLHISEIAEHRVKEVKDELREGDQVMVKVLAIEGNRIKLSRKALIKEQKAKLAQSAPEESRRGGDRRTGSAGGAAAPARPRHEFDERQPSSNQSTILIEGGDDFDEEGGEEFDEESEPNFNRVDGAPVPSGQPAGGGRPPANNNRRRRRRQARRTWRARTWRRPAVRRFSASARRPGLCNVRAFVSAVSVAWRSPRARLSIEVCYSATANLSAVPPLRMAPTRKEWGDSPAPLLLDTCLPAYIRRSAAMHSDSASDAS